MMSLESQDRTADLNKPLTVNIPVVSNESAKQTDPLPQAGNHYKASEFEQQSPSGEEYPIVHV